MLLYHLLQCTLLLLLPLLVFWCHRVTVELCVINVMFLALFSATLVGQPASYFAVLKLHSLYEILHELIAWFSLSPTRQLLLLLLLPCN